MKKQRMLISVLILIIFSIPIYSQRINSYSSDQEELEAILKKCAEYCEKLANSVLYFVCEEKIREEINAKYPRWGETIEEVYPRGEISQLLKSIKHPSKEVNTFVYDYQLIRKENKITERRILLKENNKKKNEKDAPLKTKRFEITYIVFGPIGFLSEFWQYYFDYKIIKREKFKGDKVILIEATSIDIVTDKNYGRIWVREDDFSIVKIEWDQISCKDFHLLEEDAKQFKAKPKVKFYAEYGFEKNGIRFPSKYSVTENLFRKKKVHFTRSITTVVYKDYKFFTVEWETKH